MIEENVAKQMSSQTGIGRYKQLKISVDPAIATAFKKACTATNISMAANLSQFMAEYSNTTVARKPLPDYSTRRKRRSAIQSIVKQLEQIKDSEEEYRDRIPENLQGSTVYDRAEELVSMLEEVIDLMISG
jgi:hypothetical protein